MTNEIEKQFKADVLEDIVTALKDLQHSSDKDYILVDRFKFIRDTELKYIGKSKRQKYMFALFECPYCHKIIETRKTIGLKQVCCKNAIKNIDKVSILVQ